MAAAKTMIAEKDTIEIRYIRRDIAIADLDHPEWYSSPETLIATYWSGEQAPVTHHFEARLLWSQTGLYVRFDANQQGPPVVNPDPDLFSKAAGLWERDVCEIFIAADRSQPNRYFEFEVAPTGEWLDLSLESTSGERLTDWGYRSGMEASARIMDGRVLMAIKVPFASLALPPVPGDIWLGNIFRCVGSGPFRGYLAWQPTETGEPDFHVPAKFGHFKFV
jgi:alpha-galactosidase